MSQYIFCSHCGGAFIGEHEFGYSHCKDHQKDIKEGRIKRVKGAEDDIATMKYIKEQEKNICVSRRWNSKCIG